MAGNVQPRYTTLANVSSVLIPRTTAQVKSDGTSAGAGVDFMYKVFTAGANDSFLEKIQFKCVASAAAVTSVATTLRAYLSSVASPGATTNADTFLIGEISVPAIVSSHSTNATNVFELPINYPIPTGWYVHVSQHVAQTANQAWLATAIGGDY